jgi:hypothetical protein
MDPVSVLASGIAEMSYYIEKLGRSMKELLFDFISFRLVAI